MQKEEKGFVVSARKYRPQEWNEVIGQESITETLRTSITENHLAHAYLFCGPRGVGKTTCARIFAREINQTENSEEDDFSFNMFELDAASNNKVDDIRQLTDQVRIPPQVGKYKVYIIDEVHMLSPAAFNAFLKTLEEPPSHAIFILATTEKHKIIPTILSRCQIYDFSRISVDEIVQQLNEIVAKEKIQAEDDALHVIAQKADGAMRDALSIFDQLVSFTHGNLTYEAVLKNLHVIDHEFYFNLTDNLFRCDYAQAMRMLDDVLRQGFDTSHFIAGLGEHFRDLLVCQDERTIDLIEVSDSVKSQYLEQAKSVDASWLIEGLNQIQQAEFRLKQSMNQRLLIEVALLNIANISSEKKNLSNSSQPEITIKEPKKRVDSPSEKKEEEKPIEAAEAPTKMENIAEPVERVEPATIEEEQTKTSSKSSPSDEKPTDGDEAIDAKKAQEHLSNKRRKRKLSTVSINNLESNVAEPKPEPIKASVENIVAKTGESLGFKEAWAKTMQKVEKDQNNTLYTILSRIDQESLGESNIIEVGIQHNVEQAEFDLHRTELLETLRSYTGRVDLQITSKESVQKTSTKLFTPKDKFDHLAAKNPALKTLKQRLDLDISF
ncbi:MAG: DNA polymerase III subunit gamma/tau [Salibacteraceae bacterium]